MMTSTITDPSVRYSYLALICDGLIYQRPVRVHRDFSLPRRDTLPITLMTNARDSVREGRSESPFFADHPAVRAWRSLDASVAPAAVETLKDTLRARIFRLSGPVSVIAKQVTSDAAF